MVASMLVGLANVHYWQDAMAEAQALYERVLAIQEKALGPAHYFVADALTYLGDIDYHRNQYARADERYARALSIYEKSLGPEHSFVAYTLNSLARGPFRQGN